MLRLQTCLILPLAVFIAGACASAQTYLSATITNGQENPVTVPTLSTGGARPASSGTATFVINSTNTAMTFSATIFNIDFTGSQTTDPNDNLTSAHIHAGATVTPTTNGGVVWGFFGAPQNDNNPRDVVVTPIVVTPFSSGVGGTITGKWDAAEGNGTTLAAQLPNILAGRAYINFHTTQFGGGEIRGALTLAPGITNGSTLSSGTVGAAYSQTLTAAGGVSPHTFALASGTLPAGLTLSSAGVLSGTPTTAGTSNFTVSATGSAASFSSKTFRLSILPGSLDFTSALRVGHVLDVANFVTQFVIVNLDSTPVSFQFKFWNDAGTALSFPIQDGAPGDLAGTLAPGASMFGQSAGASSLLSQGWAEVASTGRISVLANYYRSAPAGGTDAEASVIAAQSGKSIVMPFDNTQGSSTGVAVSNTNATQTITVTITLTPENGGGTASTITLPPHGHSSFLLPVSYPGTAGVRGSVQFSSTFADLAAIGLRFGPKNSFSSLGGVSGSTPN